MNHVKFDERLAFIRSIVFEEFGLESCQIEPIQYDPDCEFPYNNFIYKLSISKPFHDKRIADQLRSGRVRLPEGVSVFVVRLSNAAAGLNDVNRIENEVVSIGLFRDALSQGQITTQIVPQVYAWGSAAEGQGWIIQEYMIGENRVFKKMTIQDQQTVLLQVAEVLKAIQNFQLPSTVNKYGGLKFDQNDDIISAPITLFHGGPFSTYEALHAESIRSQLAIADKNTTLKGWRPNNIRKRLDSFLAHGLHQLTGQIQSTRMVLVHGDFTIDNLLFDPKSLRITAILDYDWSYVGSVADEFLRSFSDISGKVPGPYGNLDATALRRALLRGFPDPLPSGSSWDVAKAWDDELERENIKRPRTIQGMDPLSELFWLSEHICPFLLCNTTVAAYRTQAQKDQDREGTEKLLITFLEVHGF